MDAAATDDPDDAFPTAPDADPGAGAWADLAAVLAPHLARAAGPRARPVSVALELTRVEAGASALAGRAWVEHTTRTLVFLGAEARTADGALAAAATAVFRRG